MADTVKSSQISTTFVTYPGTEYILADSGSNALTGYTSVYYYTPIVSGNPHYGFYNLKAATDAGINKAFIDFPVLDILAEATKSTTGNCWATDSVIYLNRKILNDLWCDTQIPVYSMPNPFSYKYVLPLNDNAAWTTGSFTFLGLPRTCNVRAKAIEAAVKKTIQASNLFKLYAGDPQTLKDYCDIIISRRTNFIKGLTAYTGNLTFIPVDPNTFTTTDSTTVQLLRNYSNNYRPFVESNATKYTRAYRYEDIPLSYLNDKNKSPNGAVCCCEDPRPKTLNALTNSDTSMGNYTRTTAAQSAFGWKTVEERLKNGESISPGNTTSQAAALDYHNKLLVEKCSHIPFERIGWTIDGCQDTDISEPKNSYPYNDGKYLGTPWNINGVINILSAIGTGGMTLGLETNIKSVLRQELYGLLENWVYQLGWYTKGQLTNMPANSGQPNTNQWIEPAASLVNVCLYLGDSTLLPAYNAAIALLGEALKYEHADGGFSEGFAYAQQTVSEMIDSINYTKASGDNRLSDLNMFPFPNNYWEWAIDCQLPGNYILNASDCRTNQQANYTITNYWPSIIQSALVSGNTAALKNCKYLYPNPLSDLIGIRYANAISGVTAELTIPNYSYYPDIQQVIWRTGRDKPSVIGNPFDVPGTPTFGNTAAPHYALWAKGSSVKEGHAHRDQGHFSVYQGYKVILMDCGIDYEASNQNLLIPGNTGTLLQMQTAQGHNIMQIDGGAIGGSYVPSNSPITVNSLGISGGNIDINTTSAYTKINNCTRNITWNTSNSYITPLSIKVTDSFNKTTGVTAGHEVYRLHTGNTTGLLITGTGSSWEVSWDDVTIGITSDRNISVGSTGFQNFTQLVKTGTNLGNVRNHKMINISTVGSILAGTTFNMTTNIIVRQRPDINAFAWQWPNQWVWSGDEWSRSDNSKNLISFSQDLNLNTIPGTL